MVALDDDARRRQATPEVHLALIVGAEVAQDRRADDEPGHGFAGRHVTAPEQQLPVAEELDLVVPTVVPPHVHSP